MIEEQTSRDSCPACGEIFDMPIIWFDEGHDSRCEEKGRHAHLTDGLCPTCKGKTGEGVVRWTNQRVVVALHHLANAWLELPWPEDRKRWKWKQLLEDLGLDKRFENLERAPRPSCVDCEYWTRNFPECQFEREQGYTDCQYLSTAKTEVPA